MAGMYGGYTSPYPQMGYQQQLTQPMAQQPQQMPQVAQPTMPQMNSTIVWVKQRREAEDYLVAPNNSVVFMDEAMTHLYMKSADQFGRPTFTSKLLTDDTPVAQEDSTQSTANLDLDKYMTKEDFEKWVDDTLEKRLSELKPRQRNNNSNNRKEG